MLLLPVLTKHHVIDTIENRGKQKKAIPYSGGTL